MEMIGLEDPSIDDLSHLEELINNHVKFTSSKKQLQFSGIGKKKLYQGHANRL